MALRWLLVVCCTWLISAGSAKADLIDLGDGTVRDTQTWLQWSKDAGKGGFKTWADAVAWADNLVFAGYDDWRLPKITPVNGQWINTDYAEDGSTDVGFNNAGRNSELGHLFYVSLGNQAWGLTNTGPFLNVQDVYWTQTLSSFEGEALYFYMAYGDQGSWSTESEFAAWAVRDVPEPGSAALALIAGIGLVWSRRRKGAEVEDRQHA